MYHAKSSELEQIGKGIINAHFPELLCLSVAFVFRAEARAEFGKCVPGQITRPTDRDYALHGHDFIVTMAEDLWRAASARDRYALMDHYIAYMGLRYDKEGALRTDPTSDRIVTYLRKPDVIEFSEVVGRHGAYTAEIQDFLRTFAERRKEEKKERAGQTDPASVVLDEEANAGTGA